MNREQDLVTEVSILRKKLTETEDRLAAANGATIELTFLLYKAMTRLLTANDVNKDVAMAINIKEIMNDAGRHAVDLYYTKGIIPCGSKEMWPPFKRERNARYDQRR